MTILSFSEFTFDAMTGPRPKVLLVMLVLLSLLTTCHHRWFWAGLFGSLAAMTWQPTAVYLCCKNDMQFRRENALFPGFKKSPLSYVARNHIL